MKGCCHRASWSVVTERCCWPDLGGRGEEQALPPCAVVCREEEEEEVLPTRYERDGGARLRQWRKGAMGWEDDSG
jgi:hypothetical protein